jgi:tetratricopeptide (TPR) repeat protein
VAELPDVLHAKIAEVCAAGDALAGSGKYAEAIARYRTAWMLLPEPREQWTAASWIQVAIADAHFLAGEFAQAIAPLNAALLAGEIGNPFVHLRRGECLLETGRRDEAIQELTRAYMGAGREIFQNEDPKYLNVLRGVLKPPPGQADL